MKEIGQEMVPFLGQGQVLLQVNDLGLAVPVTGLFGTFMEQVLVGDVLDLDRVVKGELDAAR